MNSKHFSEYVIIALAISVISFFPKLVCAENQPGINYYIDGTEDYDAGMYETALQSLGKAIEIEPSNLNYQYYYAMTYSKLGRNQEAESIYKAILNQDPKNYYKAYFELVSIYTKKKEYEKGLNTLSRAEWVIPDNPRLYLERGAIYRNMKKYMAAIENFKRALELDKKLSQTVNYNIGLVYFKQKDYRTAKKMFQLVISENRDNKLAEYARKAIGSISDTVKTEKPWKVNAYVSYSYDDNISEDPLDRPGHISSLTEDTDGQYQVFFLKGEYRWLKRKDLQCLGGYKFTYINFNDSEHENSLSNNPYLLLHYNMKPYYMSLQYDFAHYFADSDERQIQHSIKPSLIIVEPYNMISAISFLYQIKDYKSDAPTEDETIWTGKFVQSVNFPEWSVTPRLSFKYGNEDSDSDEDTNYYFESGVGISAELPYELKGDLAFTDIRTDYKKIGNIKREDTGYLIEVEIGRALTRTLSTKLYYSYTHNKSNLMTNGYDPYEYEVNHVRLSFNMTF